MVRESQMTLQDELLNELNQTIQLLEAEIPANPASPKNEHIEKGLQRSLSQYFKGLKNAVDFSELERIYYRNVKQD